MVLLYQWHTDFCHASNIDSVKQLNQSQTQKQSIMATLVDVGKAGSQASVLIPAREETAQNPNHHHHNKLNF